MKIVYVSSKFPVLSETFIYEELLALKKLGHQVEFYPFYATGEKSHKFTTELEPLVTYLPDLFSVVQLKAQVFFFTNRFKKLRRVAREIVKATWKTPALFGKALYAYSKGVMLAYLLREDPPEHLHAHWATMPTTAVDVASRLLGIPYSFTSHAWDIFKQPLMLEHKFKRAAFAVTISEYNRQYLTHNFPGAEEKLHVVRCGIDLERFKYSTDHNGMHPPTILFIGRLVEKKGAEVLVRACGLLKERGFPFQCVLVGDGPLQTELTQLTDKLGIAEEVLLTGGLDQESLRAYWQTASVFVLPSVVAANHDRDGIPVALMESMAVGVPVISTTVSGIPELIEDRVSGRLVSPGDPAALADAIVELLSDKAAARRYTEKARQMIEREYDIALNARQKVELFERQLGQKG